MIYLKMAWAFLKGVDWRVWVAIALAAFIWFYGEQRYRAGREDQRAVYAKLEREKEADRLRLEREAAARDSATKRQGNAAITDARKELDDAKANLPDRGLTDRQRVRRCGELRRQGRPCQPAAPAR